MVPKELLEAHRNVVMAGGLYGDLEEAVIDGLRRQVEQHQPTKRLDNWSFRLGLKLGTWAALQQAKTRLEEDLEHSAEKLAKWIKEKPEHLTPQIAQPITENF